MVARMKENTRDYVYRTLKNKIMYLELLPGENVSEIELAEQLGVSRTPIREVMVKLVSENLVEVYPQRGSFVSKIDLEAVDEGYALRKLVEKDVLKRAMDKMDVEQFKELQKNLYLQKGNIELGESVIDRFQLDNEFHKIIYRIASRKRTWEGLQTICTHYDRLRFLDAMDKEGSGKTTLKQHTLILDALEKREFEKIDEIIDQHLSNFKEKIEKFKTEYPDYFKEN